MDSSRPLIRRDASRWISAGHRPMWTGVAHKTRSATRSSHVPTSPDGESLTPYVQDALRLVRRHAGVGVRPPAPVRARVPDLLCTRSPSIRDVT